MEGVNQTQFNLKGKVMGTHRWNLDAEEKTRPWYYGLAGSRKAGYSEIDDLSAAALLILGGVAVVFMLVVWIWISFNPDPYQTPAYSQAQENQRIDAEYREMREKQYIQERNDMQREAIDRYRAKEGI